jgi:hypothetical protein
MGLERLSWRQTHLDQEISLCRTNFTAIVIMVDGAAEYSQPNGISRFGGFDEPILGR